MFNNKKTIAAITLILTLALFSIAYAAHTTIDTNNGLVDANWSNVAVLRTDGDDFANDNYDINQVWVANAADNSGFYFRASLVGAGRLPNDYSSLEARLDCNQNGSYNDAVDVTVYYAILGVTEETVECQGNEYPLCNGANSDTNPASFAEEIAGPPYNYEWRADPLNGTTDWSQCFGAIDVQFNSLNSSLVVQDSTVMRGYNAPTAIRLTGVMANGGNPNLWVMGAMGLLLGTMATLGRQFLMKRANPA